MQGEKASANKPTRLRHGLILAFLAVQFALPLEYYVFDHTYDERFAWRMFSPIRMVRCQTRFTSVSDHQSRPIPMASEVSQPWMGWMQRGHTRVVRAAGQYWCDKHASELGNPKLSVDMTCRLPGGKLDRPIPLEEDLCAR